MKNVVWSKISYFQGEIRYFSKFIEQGKIFYPDIIFERSLKFFLKSSSDKDHFNFLNYVDSKTFGYILTNKTPKKGLLGVKTFIFQKSGVYIKLHENFLVEFVSIRVRRIFYYFQYFRWSNFDWNMFEIPPQKNNNIFHWKHFSYSPILGKVNVTQEIFTKCVKC